MDLIERHTIQDIIADFDKPSSQIESCNIISGRLLDSTSKDEKMKPEFLFETFAFDVCEYDEKENPWGDRLYFGPLFRFIKTDGIYERPDNSIVSKDAVIYWYKRMNLVNNAMLKARYAGLVWDYADVAGIEKTGALLETYCNSLCDIAQNRLTDDLNISTKYLLRAFKLSKNLKLLNERVKSEYREILLRADDYAIGVWCIISNFESTMMSKFGSMLKIMMRRIYYIEIQRIKENWERSVDCSQFLKLPALNFENSEENTLANLGNANLMGNRNFGNKTQQMGSNRSGLQLRIRMTPRRGSDITTDQALCMSVKLDWSSDCPKAPMTFASNRETTLKVA